MARQAATFVSGSTFSIMGSKSRFRLPSVNADQVCLRSLPHGRIVIIAGSVLVKLRLRSGQQVINKVKPITAALACQQLLYFGSPCKCCKVGWHKQLSREHLRSVQTLTRIDTNVLSGTTILPASPHMTLTTSRKHLKSLIGLSYAHSTSCDLWEALRGHLS